MKPELTTCPNCGMPNGIDEVTSHIEGATTTEVYFKCVGCLYFFSRYFDPVRLQRKLVKIKHHYDAIDHDVYLFAEALTDLTTPADLLLAHYLAPRTTNK